MVLETRILFLSRGECFEQPGMYVPLQIDETKGIFVPSGAGLIYPSDFTIYGPEWIMAQKEKLVEKRFTEQDTAQIAARVLLKKIRVFEKEYPRTDYALVSKANVSVYERPSMMFHEGKKVRLLMQDIDLALQPLSETRKYSPPEQRG